MQTPPQTPQEGTLRLHHSKSVRPARPGEIVYDSSFELCGYKFYIIVLPREKQPEALRRAIQMHDKTEENVRDSIKPKRNMTRLGVDVEAKFVAAGKKVYGVVIRHAVVAWQPVDTGTDTGVVAFTAEEQEKLSMAAQRQVSNKIVELFRLES